MIIGITGTLGAGKGTIVDFLKSRGFKHYSARDLLNEEIVNRGLEVTQGNMASVANDLRKNFGPGYIIEKLYEKAVEGGGNCVIESVRCPGEIEFLKKKENFILFAVDADIETRYSRIIDREESAEDEKNFTFAKFIEREQDQIENTDPFKQNLRVCIDMADYCFKNDWTIADLHKKVEKVLSGLMVENNIHVRPTWDEYFMKMASLVAERSTCLRHNIGAVIVKDKRVIATGYNGSAKGAPNCIDIGCVKNNQGIKSGTGHDICQAVHAEMNAIIQGAFHGISIGGTTMYCTHTPCILCARMIVNSGIVRVVSYHDYSDSIARTFLEEAGVVLDKIGRPSGKIKFLD